MRRGGTISISGVYGGQLDPLPMMQLFDKGVQIRMGQAHVRRWTDEILPLLEGDKDPLGVNDLTTHQLPLAEAPGAYSMLKTGRSRSCSSPEGTAMKALIINCSLRASPEQSNTQALAEVVADALREEGVEVSSVRAVDHSIPPGVESEMGEAGAPPCDLRGLWRPWRHRLHDSGAGLDLLEHGPGASV